MMFCCSRLGRGEPGRAIPCLASDLLRFLPRRLGAGNACYQEEEACRLERLLSPWLEKSGYQRAACLHTQYSLKDSLNIGLEKFKIWLKETKQWLS